MKIEIKSKFGASRIIVSSPGFEVKEKDMAYIEAIYVCTGQPILVNIEELITALNAIRSANSIGKAK